MNCNIRIQIGALFTMSGTSFLIVDFKTSEQGHEQIGLLSPGGKLLWVPNVFGYFDPTPFQPETKEE